MNFSKDPLGKAINDFNSNNYDENIIVHSDLCEDDDLPVKHLFRTYEDMAPIEQKALDLCYGKVLDVGAGTGCHSSWLNNQNCSSFAIDNSAGAAKYLSDIGLESEHISFLNFNNQKFDTILLLMNGIGIAGSLENLNSFLIHCKSLLNPGGQIICDSSDIKYLYEDDQGGQWIDLNSNYYGEMQFQMEYKDLKTEWFPWLYIDFDTLNSHCTSLNLKITKEFSSENNHFLAKITLL